MNEERRTCDDRRQQDRRQFVRRTTGGWRIRPEGRRDSERRSNERRLSA